MKLWGGRFAKPTHKWVEEYNASIHFDQELVEEDIEGSLAHVEMLETCGIISHEDGELIRTGLRRILERVRAGEVEFTIENEDIHMNIEKLLIDEIGPVGGKLHTARSRNDQSALDMHLYMKKRVKQIIYLLCQLQQVLLKKADEHIDTIMPGYTHLQQAQPVRFAHHLLAYVSMFERDIERLIDSYKRINRSPLGAGAIAGTTFPIDRRQVAERLGFEDIYDNSMDAVSDRDYLVEFLSNSSILMMHLSRFAEELIIWSSEEYQFIELDDAFCTGSSMMPQKKNPDIPELIRGKTGRVYGHLMGLLTVLKGLPLTYNKDMQEDKEGVFDTVQTLVQTLSIMAPMIETMKVKKEQMRKQVDRGFANATDLADYLVKRGLPFRQAHEIVGKAVLYCLRENKQLATLSLEELQQFSPLIEEDVYETIEVEQTVEARKSEGGTARAQVEKTWKKKQEKLKKALAWLEQNGYTEKTLFFK